MTNKRVVLGAARLAALLIATGAIPACSILGSGRPANGILWNSQSTGTVAPGAATGGLMWNNPNHGVLEPLGIVGIGAVEVTYSDVDPANYGPATAGAAEGPHPVSTSRLLDPMSEAVVDSAVQQLYSNNAGILGNPNGLGLGAGVANQGPYLATGDQKLGAISRARAKHSTIHDPAAPDPGGVVQRCTWMKINPAFTNAKQYTAFGPGLTSAQAAAQIANAVKLTIGTLNQFGATGYWTNGTVNYYVFTSINLDPNAGGP